MINLDGHELQTIEFLVPEETVPREEMGDQVDTIEAGIGMLFDAIRYITGKDDIRITANSIIRMAGDERAVQAKAAFWQFCDSQGLRAEMVQVQQAPRTMFVAQRRSNVSLLTETT